MQAELIGELYIELLNFSVHMVNVLPKRLWFATKIHLNLPEYKFLFLHLTQAALNLKQYFFFYLILFDNIQLNGLIHAAESHAIKKKSSTKSTPIKDISFGHCYAKNSPLREYFEEK